MTAQRQQVPNTKTMKIHILGLGLVSTFSQAIPKARHRKEYLQCNFAGSFLKFNRLSEILSVGHRARLIGGLTLR